MKHSYAKRLLAFLLAAMMVVGALPVTALATENDGNISDTVPEQTDPTEAPVETEAAPTDPDGEEDVPEEEQTQPSEPAQETASDEVLIETQSEDMLSGLSIISDKQTTLAPGVTQNVVAAYDANGNRVQYFVATADMSVDTVRVFASYKDMDPTNYGMSKLTQQVEAFNEKAAAGDEYYQGTVVAGINASYYNMVNGKPTGAFVMNGIDVTDEAEGNRYGYFAVMKDGSVKIGVPGEYSSDKGNIQEAIGIYTMLIIDGEICSGLNSTTKYPRQTIGITADGKVVLMTADGNQAPITAGLTVLEQAQLMADLGCVWAGHLDGGGSATYGSKPEGSDVFSINNSPSDGSPRDVSNGFIIVSTAKADGTFDHATMSVEDEYITPGSSTAVLAEGVDHAGGAAEIPADVTYSATLGTVENGVFISDGTAGDAEISMLYNGEVVGSTTVHVVVPDAISFAAESITVPYGKTVELTMTATYGINEVVMKAGDVTFTLSDPAIGTVEGFHFTASSEGTSAQVLAVLTFDAQITATATITLGKGSEVLYDFENGDVSDFGLGYTAYNYVLPEGDVYAVTAETGKVHSGNGAMALHINYSNSLESGYQMTALQFNTETVNFENATRLGMWMYIPDETVASWIRFTVTPITEIGEDGSVTTGSVINTTVCDAELSSGTGFVNTFEESGWHYLSIDLSAYKGVQLQKGQYIMQFYISDRDGASNDYYVLEHTSLPGNFTFYVDDITIDYSSAVDDRDAPVFENPTYAVAGMADAVAIAKGNVPTVTDSTVSFAAKVSDLASGNATGLNLASLKAYVDGNEVAYSYANGIISVEGIALADGVHSVKFSACDNQGNYASVIRQINVEAGSGKSTIKLVPHDATLDRILLGSVYYVDIVATDIEKVQSVTAVLDLNSISVWQLDHMEVADGFQASYSIQADENIVTITITRTGAVEATGEAWLVSMPIRTWELKMGYTYESGTKKGQTAYTYKQFRDMGEIWAMDINIEVDKGLVTFIDGTTDTFSGEGVQVDTEMWINKKANMVATDEGLAYFNNWDGGHIHTAHDVEDLAPDCTHTGYTGRTFCDVCQSVVDWGTTVPAAGHSYELVDGLVVCHCGQLLTGIWTDGSYYIDGIQAEGWIGDSYYDHGVLLTGICLVEDMYYDFGEDGVCPERTPYTGFYHDGTGWMYITIGMAVKSGWVYITTEDQWYYFVGTGYAATGTVTIDGLDYKFEGDMGKSIGAWDHTANGSRFYFCRKYYKNTWATIEGERYYFNNNGYCYKGKCAVSMLGNYLGAWEFDENGAFVTNITGVFQDAYTGLYHYAIDGQLQNNGLNAWEGDLYYARSNYQLATTAWYVDTGALNGLMPKAGTYVFGSDGKMVKDNGPKQVDGVWVFYLDGVQQYGLGLVEFDGSIYYVRGNGRLATTEWYVGESALNGLMPVAGIYNFDSTGKLIKDNGPKQVDGVWYFYLDGVQQYGLGLVEYEGDIYYVRGNGRLATTEWYVGTGALNGLAPVAGIYNFDSTGKMVKDNGPKQVNGVWYFYIDGVQQYGLGLVEYKGDIYYVRGNGRLATTEWYVGASALNGLMPTAGIYNFGSDGKLILDNGPKQVDGVWYFYVDGIQQYGLGLVAYEGDIYYVRGNGRLAVEPWYVGAESLNGLVSAPGIYNFGPDGKMILE